MHLLYKITLKSDKKISQIEKVFCHKALSLCVCLSEQDQIKETKVNFKDGRLWSIKAGQKLIQLDMKLDSIL